jgi:hypothetical protein
MSPISVVPLELQEKPSDPFSFWLAVEAIADSAWAIACTAELCGVVVEVAPFVGWGIEAHWSGLAKAIPIVPVTEQ